MRVYKINSRGTDFEATTVTRVDLISFAVAIEIFIMLNKCTYGGTQ